MFTSAGMTAAPTDTLATLDGNVRYRHKSLVNTGGVDGITEKERWSTVYNASVQLFRGKDTLKTATWELGNFGLRNIAPGDWTLRVSCVGFLPKEMKLSLPAGRTMIYVELERETERLKAATVTAESELMKRDRDTIRYNARAVKTQEGDDAIEILRQMPGVSIEGNKVKIFGEPVVRTYVNGLLIYGDAPGAALNALAADQVVSMKVYDEQAPEDRRKGLKHSQKERVLDIETKDPILSAVDGHFIASGGMDTGRGESGQYQGRYGAGATLNLFSEKLLLFGNTYADNIGRGDNRLQSITSLGQPLSTYREDTHFDGGVTKYWKDRFTGHSLDAGYCYDRGWERSRNRSRNRYLASEETPGIDHRDTVSTKGLRETHFARVELQLKDTPLKDLSFKADFLHSDDLASSLRAERNRYEGGESARRENARNKSGSWEGRTSLRWSTPKNNRGLLPSLGVFFTVGEDRSDGRTVDTLELSANRRFLTTRGSGKHYETGGTARINYLLSNSGKATTSLIASYRFNIQEKTERKTALHRWGALDGTKDPTLSFDFTYHTHQHELALGIDHNTSRLKLSGGSRLDLRRQEDRERYPDTYNEKPRWFFAPLPTLSLSLTNKKKQSVFHLLYNAKSSIPAIEQLRRRLDDRNPMFIRKGNPALKQQVRHEIGFSGSPYIGEKGNILILMGSFNFSHHPTVTRLEFFPAATPRDGYTFPAGSTLLSYENAPGALDGNVAADYRARFKPWKSMLTLTGRYSFSRNPFYEGSRRDMAFGSHGELAARLSGTPQKWLRYYIGASWSPQRSVNGQGAAISSGQQWSLNANFNLRFLKWGFLSAKYTHSLDVLSVPSAQTVRTGLLNAVAGWRFLQGRLTLSLSGNDLLDAAAAYQRAVLNNCVSQTWKPYSGRYVMLHLGYRLNKTGGKSFVGSLSQGWNRVGLY